MGTTARSVIRQEAAQEVGLYASGTATGGTTTTLIDTVRRKERDDYWNNSQLYLTSGTLTPLTSDVSDSVRSTSILTVLQTLSGSPTTETYDLYRPPFKVGDYNEAINAALDEAYAKGFARRTLDETLFTTRQRYYTLPSTLEEVAELLVARHNFLLDPDWAAGGSGWTLHADGSFTNDGDLQERTLKHTISGASQYTRIDLSVEPGREYSFRANVKSDATAVAIWRYQWINTSGSLIGSATNFGTRTAATFALITGNIIAPSNAQQVRLQFGSSSASGSIYTHAQAFWPRGDYEQWPRGYWGIQWDGTTGRLEFRTGKAPINRVIQLRGKRVLETLTADTDTVSFDTPEYRWFIYLVCRKLWEQRLGKVQDQDADHARGNITLWRSKLAELGQPNFDNWKQRRTVSTPVGSG